MSDTDEVTIVDPEEPKSTNPSTPPLDVDEVSIVEPSGENFDDSVNTSNYNTNEEFGEEIEVADIETVPTHEREIEKEIFLQVMEGDMLRDVPVGRQNNLEVQERIRKKAENLWMLKQNGDKIISQEKAGEKDYRPLVDSLDQGYFHLAPWVLPVVMDVHSIYALRCHKLSKDKEPTNENNFEDENEFTGEVPFGDKMENQMSQMKAIQGLLRKLYDGDINYVSYASGSTRERAPYRPPAASLWDESPEPLPKSHRFRLRTYEELVRLINLKKRPKTRIGRAPLAINVFVPEKRKRVESIIAKTQENRRVLTAVSGEEIDIVGFLILPFSTPDINEKIAKAAHDGKLLTAPEELNDMIKKALERTTIIKDDSSLKVVDPQEPQLFLFGTGTAKNHQVPFKLYSKLLRTFAPTSEQAVDFALKDSNEPDILSVSNSLHKWGLELGLVESTAWQKARDAIAATAKENVPQSVTGLKIEDRGQLCSIKTVDELLRDDEYYSKFMRTSYAKDLGYADDLNRQYRGPDCLGHRFNRLFKTQDNGSFYYTFSLLHLRKPSVQKEVERLAALQKKFVAQQKILTKNAREGSANKDLSDLPVEENGSINLVKVRDAFKKLLAVPQKTADARKNLPLLEKSIENLIAGQKKLANRKTILSESAFNKAGRLFLYRMGETAALIRKTGMSDIDLGRILHEREKRDENIDKTRPIFMPLDDSAPAIQSILDQINNLDNIQEKTETIYTIIEQDGMLIDKFIYSVRYAEPIFCGHWHYFMLADRAVSTKEREQWVRQVLSIFGSDNKKEGSYNCVVCGAYLDRTSYYEALHFDQYGLADRQREAYVSEKRHKNYLHAEGERFDDTISMSVKLCRGAVLKSEIASRGLKTPEDTKRAVIACDILDRILAKMDIFITPKQFLGLILVSLQDSQVIADYHSFFKDKVREVKTKKKLSNRDVSRLENNERFTDMVAVSYAAHFTSRFGTLVVAHLLWHLRTVVPPKSPGPKTATSCSFFGFDGEGGFEYILCLLLEMKTIRARLTIRGQRIDKPVRKKDIEEHLRYWLRVLAGNYKHALKRKLSFEADEERFAQRKGSKRLDREEEDYDWGAQKIPPMPKEFVSEVYKAWKVGNGKRITEFFNQNNLRAKRLTFQFQDDIEEVLKEVGTDDKPQYVETTCCEQKTKSDLPFLAFYDEFKPSLKTISDELQVLQKQLLLLQQHQFNTQFTIYSHQPPMRNLSRYPIKNTDYPESFVKDTFLAFCHDGVSSGEYHSFQNTEFEKITRCVKCGWFKKKLEDTTFSREQFNDLLQLVYIKSLVLFEFVEPKQMNKKLIAMKREASRNLSSDIHKLSTRLARVMSKSGKDESESGMQKKFEKFMTEMDDFRVYIPDPPKGGDNDKFVVENANRRAYFSQQKMKEYINEVLRRNVSRVARGYKPKISDLPWLSGKELEKWQQRLLDNKLWLEPFLIKANRVLFKKFAFDYTVEEISAINGVSDVYGPDWKWILRPSLFTPTDAVKVLKHYFVIQLSLFLDISGAGEPVVAEFINNIFAVIMQDRHVLNVPQRDITKWEDSRTEERVLAWARYYDAIREEDALLFNAPYRRFTELAYDDPFVGKDNDGVLELEENDFNKKVNAADKDSFLHEQAKAELGDDATDQAIESYVQDALEEDHIDEEVNEEVFDNPILKEGEEIMDIGTEYGQLPQGTETAGDGFNDYTMTEAWDPVHEPDVLGIAQ